jgi:hypothetical protein
MVNEDPPYENNITRWLHQFEETRSMLEKYGRPEHRTKLQKLFDTLVLADSKK